MSNLIRDALLNAADFLDSRRSRTGGNFAIAAQALRDLAFPALPVAWAQYVNADGRIRSFSRDRPEAETLAIAAAEGETWRPLVWGDKPSSELRSQLASLQRLAFAGEHGEVDAHEACREIAARLPDVLRLAATS